MATDTNGVIVQVNFKDNTTGNLYNVYGRTEAEFVEGLNILKAYLGDIAEVNSLLRAGDAVSSQMQVTNVPPTQVAQTQYAEPAPTPAPATPPSATWGAPATAPQTASPSSQPMCAHGPRVIRKGVSAKGPWMGAFCPTAKGTPGQCEPQWIKKDSPEWIANS